MRKGATDSSLQLPKVSFYSELDLPSVGLVTPGNYHWRLQQLAIQVNALQVLWWPAEVTQTRHRDARDTFPDPAPFPRPGNAPSSLVVTAPLEGFASDQAERKYVASSWSDSAEAGATQYVNFGGDTYHHMRQVHYVTHGFVSEVSLPGGSGVEGETYTLHRWAYNPYQTGTRSITGVDGIDEQDPDAAATYVLPSGSNDQSNIRVELSGWYSWHRPFRFFIPTGSDLDDFENEWRKGKGYLPLFISLEATDPQLYPGRGGSAYPPDDPDAVYDHNGDDDDSSDDGYGQVDEHQPVVKYLLYQREYQHLFVAEFSKGLSRDEEGGSNPAIESLAKNPTAPVHVSLVPFPDPSTLFEINLGTGSKGPGAGRLAVLNWRTRDRRPDHYDAGVFDDPEIVREFPRDHHDPFDRMRELTCSSRIIVDGFDPLEDPAGPGDAERNAQIRSIFGLDSNDSIAGYEPLGNGFDAGYPSLASDLRFLGATSDFRVLADSSTDKAPEWLDSSENPINTFASHRGWFSHEFLRVWHRPVIRQVVGRTVIANIEVNPGGFGATITLYHRDPNVALTADHEPIDVSELTGFMSYTIEPLQPDNAQDPVMRNGFPTEFRGVKVTQHAADLDTIYELRSTDAGGVAKIVREGEEVASCTLTINEEDDSDAEDSYFREFKDNGILVSKTEVTLDAGQSGWKSHQFSDPACAAKLVKSGSGNDLQTTTFEPDSRFPEEITTETNDSPDSVSKWTPGDFPVSDSQGNWVTTYSEEEGAMVSTSKLGESAYARSWIKWSKQGSVVKVFEAPHLSGEIAGGEPITKTYSGNSRSVLTFDMGNSEGSSAVPWSVVKSSSNGLEGSQTTYTRTASSGLLVVTESGRLNADLTGIIRGLKTTTTINKNGFTTSSLQQTIPGGVTVGGWTSSGSGNAWGGPETISPMVPEGLGNESVTYRSDFPLVASSTNSFGIKSTVEKLDWAGRATSYNWDDHPGTIKYNDGQLGVKHRITIDGRVKEGNQQHDILGRSKGFEFEGNQHLTREYRRNGGQLDIDTINHTTSAESALSVDQNLGAATNRGGNLSLPSTGSLSVEGGLLKSKAQLEESDSTETITYSDAWGRTHKIISPSSAGGTEVTTIEYSGPGESTQRVVMHEASGRVVVQQSENPADPIVQSVDRTGYDLNGDGKLTLGSDRFEEVTTSLSGGFVFSFSSTTDDGDQGPYLDVRGYSIRNLTDGSSQLVINDDEEAISSNIVFPIVSTQIAYQVYTQSSAGWSVVKDYDGKGQLLRSSSSGAGIPTSVSTPTRHADGSLTKVESVIGSSRSSVSFAPCGEVTGFSSPILGIHDVTTEYGNGEVITGVESLGLNATSKFDGTRSIVSGENVIDEERTTNLDNGVFTHGIKALEADQLTTVVANSSGANIGKNYEAGPGISTSWRPGYLIDKVSRARGGEVNFFYSEDGAQDLRKIQYPAFGDGSILEEEFVTGAGGNVIRITDQSGTRDRDFGKGRLENEVYTDGLLAGYQVDPQFDGLGRRTGVVLTKDGTPIHSVTYSRNNGNSNELSGVTTPWMNASYVRDPNNRWITEVERGGPDLIYQRDGAKAGRLARVTSEVPGAPSFKYQRFDRFGRRTLVLGSQGHWSYDYDSNGQLIGASNSDGPNFIYEVDSIGRRRHFMTSGGMGPSGDDAYALNQPHGSFGHNPFASG